MKFVQISAIAAVLTFSAASYQPAQAFVAAPAPTASQVTAGDVIKVQRRGVRRGFNRGYRRGFRRGYWRGYRRNRGRYIAGGLIAGAIIGSVIAAPRYYDRPRYRYRPRRVGVRGAHERWCHRRYRSYRAYDNTFQPYHGPRRACLSPFN